MSSPSIDIAEIRRLANMLFDRLVENGANEIPIDRTDFWQVYFEDAFSIVIPTPTLADITDCISDLREEVAAAR